MRPGKIFRPTGRSVPLYPTERRSEPDLVYSRVFNRETFFVVCVDLDEKLTEVANFYNIYTPWLVIFGEKVWLAEIRNRTLMDLTPWAPWDKDYKHNAELLKDYKHHVRIPSD